jgi:hypothetical protein
MANKAPSASCGLLAVLSKEWRRYKDLEGEIELLLAKYERARVISLFKVPPAPITLRY